MARIIAPHAPYCQTRRIASGRATPTLCGLHSREATMPYLVRYTPSGADVRFTGVATGAEIVEAKALALSHRYDGPLRFLLFDLGTADQLDIPTADVRRVAREDREYAERHPPFAIVVVAPHDLEYGLSRMWQAFVDDTPIDSNVARTRAEAVGWLAGRGLDVAHL
jgi:hypothetical protein